MFDPDETPAPESTTRGSSHMDGTKSLERLRDRVNLAVKELQRLREENASLRKELKSSQKARAATDEGSVIHFNEGPAELRSQVQALIDSIDERIEKAQGAADD